MGLSLKMFASESRGEYFPPMAAYYGDEVDCTNPDYPPVAGAGRVAFFWNPESIHPEYLADLSPIVCPSDSDFTTEDLVNPQTGTVDVFRRCSVIRGWSLLDESYVYLGHVFDKMGDAASYAIPLSTHTAVTGFPCDPSKGVTRISAQFTAMIATVFGGALSEIPDVVKDDYDVSAFEPLVGTPIGTGDLDRVLRLREGVERFLITDVNSPRAADATQSRVELMWDRTGLRPSEMNHAPAGSNVLYLDGHVSFVRHPGANNTSISAATGMTCLL